MTKSHTLRIAAGAALAMALALGGAMPAFATPSAGEATCLPKGDKIDTTGSPESVTVTAPAGYLITGYCVKAGSANQGLGPEEHTITPSESVTFTHSSGKDISHYVIRYAPKPPVVVVPPVEPPVVVVPPTEPPVVVPPVTEEPPVVVPPVTVDPPVVEPPITIEPPVVVGPPVIEEPPVVVIPPVSLPEPKAPVVTEPVAQTELAATGPQDGNLAGAALALLLLGVLMLVSARRRAVG